MSRRLQRILAAGWLIVLAAGGSPAFRAEENRHQVRLIGSEWKRPHHPGEQLRLGWILEGEGPLAEPLFRLSFSRDGGATWTEIYKGIDTGLLWEMSEQADTTQAALRVELLGKEGQVLTFDEEKGLVIDGTAPRLSAKAAETSIRREVPIRVSVDQIGPSGVALVQVWVTPDGGKRWEYAGSQREVEAPFILRRPRGKWGVTLTGVSSSRMIEQSPKRGEAPEITVDIEPEEPIVSMKVDPVKRFYQGGEVIKVEWSALDEDLAERGVTLEYRKSDGQWVSLLENQERQGEHAWNLPKASLGVSEIRVRVKDMKGNEGIRTILLGAWVDADPPHGEILGPAVYDKPGLVEVKYQLNEIGSGLASAAIHFRERPDEDWRVFAHLASSGTPARRELGDGTYQFAMTAADRAKNKMEETFDRPFRVVVDRIAPVVKVEDASARGDSIQLRWKGIDANLGPSPVRILYRWDEGGDWMLLKSELSASGESSFPLPDGGKSAASLSLRVSCTDLSGKEASETAVVKVGVVLPTVGIKQARFVQPGRIRVGWEASGEGIGDQPVAVEAATEDGTVFFKQSALPATGAIEIDVPMASQGKDLSVIVKCANRWSGEASERATLRAGGGGPRVKVGEATVADGKLRVEWEAQGESLGDSPVSVQYEEEGGKVAKIWKDLPRIGSLSWDLPESFRGTVRVRATCTDMQGRVDQASVLAVLSGAGPAGAAVRLREVSRKDRRLTISWEAAAQRMPEKPVTIEARFEGEKGEWKPVQSVLPARGSAEWDVPAESGDRLRLRVACRSGEAILYSDERSVNLKGGASAHSGAEVRAVWRGARHPAQEERTDIVPPADPLAPARALLAQGLGEEAAKTLRLYLSAHPDSLDAYLLLIRAGRLKGSTGMELVELYRKALALSPRNADLLNELGVYHLLEEKDPVKGLEYFQEALQSSHTAGTFYNVGRAQYQLREYGLAAAAFEKAVEVDPDLTNASFYLAQIYTQTHLKDRARAVSCWRKVRDASGADEILRRRAEAELSRLGAR